MGMSSQVSGNGSGGGGGTMLQETHKTSALAIPLSGGDGSSLQESWQSGGVAGMGEILVPGKAQRPHRAIKTGAFVTGAFSVAVGVICLACVSTWSLALGLFYLVGGAVSTVFGYCGARIRSTYILGAYVLVLCAVLSALPVAMVYNTHLAIQSFRAIRHVYFDEASKVSPDSSPGLALQRRYDRRPDRLAVRASSSGRLAPLLPSDVQAPHLLHEHSNPCPGGQELHSVNSLFIPKRRLPEPAKHTEVSRGRPHCGFDFDRPHSPRASLFQSPARISENAGSIASTVVPALSGDSIRASDAEDSIGTVEAPVPPSTPEKCQTVPESLVPYVMPTRVQLQTYGLLCGFSLYDIWGVVDAWELDCENYCGYKFLATKRFIWDVDDASASPRDSVRHSPAASGATTWGGEVRLPAQSREHRSAEGHRQPDFEVDSFGSLSASEQYAAWTATLPEEDQTKCTQNALSVACGVVKTFYLVLLPALSVVMVVAGVGFLFVGIAVVKKAVAVFKHRG